MFIDTSAIAAILLAEETAGRLEAAIGEATICLTSPVVILEASMVLSSKWQVEPDYAESEVRFLLEKSGVAITQIDDQTATLAVAAFTKYGKGRGNSAKLNLADCLSYACAKQHRMPLLYIGDDFTATDLA